MQELGAPALALDDVAKVGVIRRALDLQRLERDPLFTEVVFSRATSNTRYYIDLRLANVNFEAYRVRHFPDES